MRDLKKYWQEVRAIEATLAESVWLTSFDDRKSGQVGGSVTEVPAAVAARLLHAKTHRVSSEAEIQGYLEREQERKRDTFHERLRVQGIAVAPVRQHQL
jgi:hypothetical protein